MMNNHVQQPYRLGSQIMEPQWSLITLIMLGNDMVCSIIGRKEGTNTNPIEVETILDVGVQTMEAPSVLTNQNSSINKATSVRE
jgi:hypothetical protein